MLTLDAFERTEDLSSRLARIGNTPLTSVNLRLPGRYRLQALHLKLESFNPGGSVKDRTALALIRDMEGRGELRPGGTVIESTSGNLGVALAYICAALGYQFVAVVDPKTTPENLKKIVAFGARVEMVTKRDETGGYLLSRLEKVKELLLSVPNSCWTNQYENQANVQAHYRSTGPEILHQMSGIIDVVFLAISTGGTLAGISRQLRSEIPDITVVAVDAQGSVALGGAPGPRLLTGMGASRRSSFVEASDYAEVAYVNDADAFACCRALWNCAGIKVGGSSGAAVAAAIRWLSNTSEPRRAVCLCPDTGDNYASSIFDDAYVAQTLPQTMERTAFYDSVILRS